MKMHPPLVDRLDVKSHSNPSQHPSILIGGACQRLKWEHDGIFSRLRPRRSNAGTIHSAEFVVPLQHKKYRLDLEP